MDIQDQINRAAQAVDEADAALITAGAGMGVDSGLPDFRGDEGFWKAYPPIAKLGISFYEMANPHWFEADPYLAWGFYGHRLNLYRSTVPHAGFSQLLELAESKPAGYFVFTSNVDGQFQKAGFSEDRIEECHGSIHHLQCTGGCSRIRDGNRVEVAVDEGQMRALDPLPQCEDCGRLARPNILMFGDWHWISSRSDEQSRRFNDWLRKIRKEERKLVVIEIGAGSAVPTVRMQSERAAGHLDGALVRINPREPYAGHGHVSLPMGGAEGIRKIFEAAASGRR